MKTFAIIFLLLIGFAAGFVGFLHTPSLRQTPFAMKVLTWLGTSCPTDFLTAQGLDHLRHDSLVKIRGASQAPTKTVWGLTLNRSNEAELLRWMRDRRFTCEKSRRGYVYYKCKNISLTSLGRPFKGPIGDLDFVLDAYDRLIFVGFLQGKMESKQAFALFRRISQQLKLRLGEPSRKTESFSFHDFTKDLNAITTEYRFKDYLAKVIATRIPQSGVMLYEQHIALPENFANH
ncbi:hypothetical protein [Bdellovibrio bacteriovorus]|uniref:hypothetical protein n=1 Tax=Bdellovibrio bacteriovorus TaxID=959 RepID=UPI0035A6C1F1